MSGLPCYRTGGQWWPWKQAKLRRGGQFDLWIRASRWKCDRWGFFVFHLCSDNRLRISSRSFSLWRRNHQWAWSALRKRSSNRGARLVLGTRLVLWPRLGLRIRLRNVHETALRNHESRHTARNGSTAPAGRSACFAEGGRKQHPESGHERQQNSFQHVRVHERS